jgi:CHAT domain-containing protein/Tfp pilus assembly protein PilF
MTGRCILLECALFFGMLLAVPLHGETLGLDPRLDAAVLTYRQHGAQKALPQFERLAREFGKAGKSRDESAALHYIGECHWRLGGFNDAQQFLDRALVLERQSQDRAGEGRTLNVLGLLAWDEGNYDQAIAQFKAAGAVARQLGDKKLEGASLNNLSLVYDELGEYDTSLEQYAQVLELYRSVDFPRGVGDTLGNIGGVHLLLGQFREALGYYQRALKISEQLKSTASMSQDHGNVALCLLGLGDADDALKHFDQAIALAKQAGMRQDQAYWLRQKGNGLIQLGQYDRGLAGHRAALAVYEELGARSELAEALHDTGRLHLLLGDPDSAERYFTRALALSRQAGLARGITQNLIALGDLQFRRKAFDIATKLYQQAQQRSAKSGERHLQAQSLLRLAQVDREQQRLTPASTETGQALAIAREIDARPLEAEALLAQGDLQRRKGQLAEAVQSFKLAEAALESTRDPDLLWRIDYGRARTQEARGEARAAIDSLLSAVRTIEGVRNRLQESRFRAGFVDDKYEVYIDLVRLQLQLGRTEDAFSTAERLRARSFAEQLGGRTPLPLSDESRRQEAQLLDRIRQLQHALSEEDRDGQPIHVQRAMSRFSQELQRAEQEYQAFLDDHAGSRASAKQTDTTSSLSSVQRRLQDDEALIEYVVGPDSVMTFVVTGRAMTARTTPLRHADLNARIALLRDLAQRPSDNRWLKPAARLSADLVTPLLANGQLNGIRRLYVVPHDVLNYLPFALLPIDAAPTGSLLIDNYAVAYLPAAAVLLRDSTEPPAPRSLLALAPARSRLRYAPEEARSINAMFTPNSRLLVGNSATESQFKRLSGDFGMLHLATHGLFNKVNPLLSGLELEADADNDGLLQVHEVLGLRLNANLVTLSACESGLSSGYFAEVPAGDDFVGMTRAFLAAGSGSVVATLWDVDDQASGRLMKRFYGRLKQSVDNESTADSLTHAQREIRSNQFLGHPYYWAPFVVVGAMTQSSSRTELAAGR